MAYQAPRVQAGVSAAELADVFDEHGLVIIENVLSREFLEEFRSELAAYVEATPTGADDFEGMQTTRTGGLVWRSEKVRQLVANPLVTGMCTEIFGEDMSFQMNQGQLIAVGPNETPQPVHRDQWLYGSFPFPPGYEAIIQSMWALTPFTEENGATRYVPQSHRIPEQTKIIRQGNRTRTDHLMNSAPETVRFHFEDTLPLEMDAGSVALWSGQLYHGGGANKTNEARWGLNIGYTRGWIRQEENQYLSADPETFKDLDDDFARLIGWARSGYGQGYVGDMRDPLDVARGREGHQGFGDPNYAPNKLLRDE